MKKLLLALIIAACLFGSWFLPNKGDEQGWDNNTPVAQVLFELGVPYPDHYVAPDQRTNLQEEGERLVKRGLEGKRGFQIKRKQSVHFVCTSCHNTKQEDPDLSVSDPEARLEFAAQNDLPFLPGTTLWGAVNRTTYYNGDYEKKYGELVEPARNDLKESIQLCATECSQGRRLNGDEMKAVVAYLWSLELKMSDLNLSAAENEILKNEAESTDSRATLIRSKYLSGSPATFRDAPSDRKKGYASTGSPEKGKMIYERSCLHCHSQKRFALFALDETNFSKRFLKKHTARYTRYSMYQVIAYGASGMPGKKAYMPNYTRERLSDAQIEDLRAFISK